MPAAPKRAGPASVRAGRKRPATHAPSIESVGVIMAERLLAYSDRISAAAGERIEIKVSAPEGGEYQAKLIRLICGDESADGPGFKAEDIKSPIAKAYPARLQPIHAGSHIAFHKG